MVAFQLSAFMSLNSAHHQPYRLYKGHHPNIHMFPLEGVFETYASQTFFTILFLSLQCILK